jgi:hypothetical protein
MMNLVAEMAMNLIGLILIAALSGGIVAVSLRLRTSSSSGGLGLDGERVPGGDWQHRGWVQGPISLKSESGAD